jgi:hypothetical protein
MKTEKYKFIIELPDGKEIISDEHEYTYLEFEEDYEGSEDFVYEDKHDMLEQIEIDKIEFVFNNLSIRHERV